MLTNRVRRSGEKVTPVSSPPPLATLRASGARRPPRSATRCRAPSQCSAMIRPPHGSTVMLSGAPVPVPSGKSASSRSRWRLGS